MKQNPPDARIQKQEACVVENFAPVACGVPALVRPSSPSCSLSSASKMLTTSSSGEANAIVEVPSPSPTVSSCRVGHVSGTCFRACAQPALSWVHTILVTVSSAVTLRRTFCRVAASRAEVGQSRYAAPIGWSQTYSQQCQSERQGHAVTQQVQVVLRASM